MEYITYNHGYNFFFPMFIAQASSLHEQGYNALCIINETKVSPSCRKIIQETFSSINAFKTTNLLLKSMFNLLR